MKELSEETKKLRAESFRKHAYERAEKEIGNTYNNLTVSSINYDETEEQYKNGNKYIYCNFQCNCGNTIVRKLNDVKCGHIKSCGCIKFNNPKNIDDLTNQKFGRLTVIGRDLERDTREQTGIVHWLCQCDCGNPKLSSVVGFQLKSGRTQSCGCYASEQIKKRNKKYSTKINNYEVLDDCAVIFDNKNNKCMIDKEDLNTVLKWYWRKVPKRGDMNKGYWVTNTKDTDKYNKKILMLHQIVGEIKYGEYDTNYYMTDHLSRDTDDNRKRNLYLKNNISNTHNRSLSKANTSGKTGVSFNNQKNTWTSYITVAYKTIYFGDFDKYEDAVAARRKAEDEYGFTCDDKVPNYDNVERNVAI